MLRIILSIVYIFMLMAFAIDLSKSSIFDIFDEPFDFLNTAIVAFTSWVVSNLIMMTSIFILTKVLNLFFGRKAPQEEVIPPAEENTDVNLTCFKVIERSPEVGCVFDGQKIPAWIRTTMSTDRYVFDHIIHKDKNGKFLIHTDIPHDSIIIEPGALYIPETIRGPNV